MFSQQIKKLHQQVETTTNYVLYFKNQGKQFIENKNKTNCFTERKHFDFRQ